MPIRSGPSRSTVEQLTLLDLHPPRGLIVDISAGGSRFVGVPREVVIANEDNKDRSIPSQGVSQGILPSIIYACLRCSCSKYLSSPSVCQKCNTNGERSSESSQYTELGSLARCKVECSNR